MSDADEESREDGTGDLAGVDDTFKEYEPSHLHRTRGQEADRWRKLIENPVYLATLGEPESHEIF